MPIVVIELWKSKSTVSEGALLRIKFSGIKKQIQLMNHQDNIGESGQYELIKRRRSEIPDSDKGFDSTGETIPKSQKKSGLYRQKAFEVLTARYGLIDPTNYSLSLNRK